MSFIAQITADISNFDKNIKKATDIADSSTKKMQAQFDKLGDSFVKIGAKASILSTAIVGATVGLVKMGISAGNASAEINNLSTATSLSTDVILKIGYVCRYLRYETHLIFVLINLLTSIFLHSLFK